MVMWPWPARYRSRPRQVESARGQPLLRECDLRLAARDVTLHTSPHAERGERRAVALRAQGELVDQRTRLRALSPRRLCRAPHVVVVGALGFDPRLLEVR